jgi:hypothetical protein
MKGGEKHMNEKHLFPMALYLAKARRADELREAADVRKLPRHARPSVRRSVGQSLVRLGVRLAGEPNLRPARFR